jgi:hypothetical protein
LSSSSKVSKAFPKKKRLMLRERIAIRSSRCARGSMARGANGGTANGQQQTGAMRGERGGGGGFKQDETYLISALLPGRSRSVEVAGRPNGGDGETGSGHLKHTRVFGMRKAKVWLGWHGHARRMRWTAGRCTRERRWARWACLC